MNHSDYVASNVLGKRYDVSSMYGGLSGISVALDWAEYFWLCCNNVVAEAYSGKEPHVGVFSHRTMKISHPVRSAVSSVKMDSNSHGIASRDWARMHRNIKYFGEQWRTWYSCQRNL